MIFGRICAVCNKKMGNSLHRESYNLGKDDGCHVDVHIKCVKKFEKDEAKYAKNQIKIDTISEENE